MATVASRSFAFIDVGDFGKPKASDRKLIRSQCMRGKNRHRRIGVRPVSPVPARANYDKDGYSPVSPSASSSSNELPQGVAGNITNKTGHQRDAPQVEPKSVVPRPLSSDLLLAKFPCEVDYHSQELLFQFMNEAKETMYPLELCVDFDLDRSLWFQWIFHDAAYLHSVLCGTSATRDVLRQKPPTKSTFSHMRQSIAYLNEDLSNSGAFIKDSTVAVIVQLAMFAILSNDHASIKTHMFGLKRIVRLRGGMDAFRHDAKLFMKIGRLDLAYSLNSGEDVTLSTDLFRWDPFFYNIGPLFGIGGHDPAIYGLQDPRLALIFFDMQHYACLMNGATANKQRHRVAEFHSVICSVQYRLMQLQGMLDDILAECLRLAMLAFVTTMFQLPYRRMPYPYLADRFRECCRAVASDTPQMQDLMLWLLIIGAISVFEIDDEPWMRERWGMALADVAWPEARRRLKEIMWMDAMHDKLGKTAYEAMSIKAGGSAA